MNARPLRTRSIRVKIIALCVTLAGVCSLAVAWTSTQFQTRALKQSSTELQLALIKDIAQKAEQEFEQTQRDFFALTHALTQARWGPDAQISVAKALLESMPRLDELSVYDAKGQFIDRIAQRSGAAGPGPTQRLDSHVQNRSLSQGRWIGEVDPSATGGPRQRWVLPLRAQGRHTGFVSSPVRLAPLTQRLAAIAQLQLTGTAHALYIADANGCILASSSPKAKTQLANAQEDPLFKHLAGQGLPPDQGVAKEIVESPGYAPAYLATVMRLSAQPWLIVAKVPTEAAYAPLQDLRRQLLWSITALLGASLLIAFVLARRVSQPLEALVSMAQRLERGRFDHTALLQRQDEIGEVARAMNQAVKEQHLRGTSRSKDTRDDAPSIAQTHKQTPFRELPQASAKAKGV